MPGREDPTPGRPATDAELITRYRDSGADDVFDELGERHVEAARRLAAQLTSNEDAAENLLAEAFEIARTELARGNGPDLAFRPYLLTLVRDVAGEWSTDGKRLLLSDGYDALAAARDGVDDTSLAARAFARMPERWRVALWHTAVEGESPADIAPLLGLSPSAVNTLVQRARDGLRRVYLQADLDDEVPRECHDMRDRMAEDARGRLSRRHRGALDDHIDNCDRCRAVFRDVAEVDASLGKLVGGAVLGPFAAGYVLPPDPSMAEEAGEPRRRRAVPLAAVFAGVGIVVVGASAFAVISMSGGDDTRSTAQATPGARTTAPGTSAQPSTGPRDWTAWPSHRPHRSESDTPDPHTSSAPSHTASDSDDGGDDDDGDQSHEPRTRQPGGHVPSSQPQSPSHPQPSKSHHSSPPPETHSPTPTPSDSCGFLDPSCWFH